MQVIAHRGGAGLRIENTLAALANAIELGAAGAELDVHLTRDGEVVVHHDARLNPAYCRKPSGAWITAAEAARIDSLDWAELQRYEIGMPNPADPYAAQFPRIQPEPDQHIPRLADVIRMVQQRDDEFRLIIELKSPMLQASEQPWQALLAATLLVIAETGFGGRATLCGFDWGALREAHRRMPRLETWFTSPPLSWLEGAGTPPSADIPPDPGYLESLRARWRAGNAAWCDGHDPRNYRNAWPEAIAAAGGGGWLLYHRDCSEAVAYALHERSLACVTWSANLDDAAELARLARCGCDYVMLDYPDVEPPSLPGER